MRIFEKSEKLHGVCYDVRGPVLDEANAMAELNDAGDSVEDLAKKYDSDSGVSAVDDELAALKSKMGL